MEPFYGQVIMFAGNFAPRGWLFCEGQLLPIAQNQTLFSLLGTVYGGDGRSTFGLPDLRGRVPMGAGNGPGLSPRTAGQKFGEEQHTLIDTEIPAHNHSVAPPVFADEATSENPTNTYPAVSGAPLFASTHDATSGNFDTGLNGGGRPHNNIQPTQVIGYIIANSGIYPSRN
tara:strand:+ start:1208 stop:1723 length:516 start_codon:yes stop_codon:yes gene_type:complete